MGIFTLFGKKDEPEEKPSGKNSSHAKRDNAQPGVDGTRPQSGQRKMHVARATALKIDAIESEMSSEFVRAAANTQPGNSIPGPATVPGNPSQAPRAKAGTPDTSAQTSASKLSQPTLPVMGPTTEFLLDGATAIGDIAIPASDPTAVLEEAAILFANGQVDVVEQMLLGAIQEDNLGGATLTAWWMLFDLYQIGGKQQEFENLSIEYLSKFETSPPAWNNASAVSALRKAPAAATPTATFSGKLDANSVKQLDRLQKLSETNRALRLEFNRVSEVDAAGCSLLLDTLKKLHKSGHDLILVGAPELMTKIRAIVEVGRRDETEDPWLLLLEILRLLNREKEFEEASIDYCVTFEVSPPAFVAPKNKVTTAAVETAMTDSETDHFKMPAVIEGAIDPLILAIGAHADQHNPAIIDCSRLTRVDFNAAGRLLTGLAPFCGNGKTIELHHVNHLVTALFSIIGLKEMVRIFPRKS